MPTLINYAYNPAIKDQKLYGLVRIKGDDNEENDILWLASTLDEDNFNQWQLLKSFKGIINPNTLYDYLTTMQIKDNYIYITNRGEKTLFVIAIEYVNKVIDEIKLPAEVDDDLEIYQSQSLFIQPTSIGANLYICAGNKILLNKPTDRKTWTTFYESNDDSLIMIKANEDIMVLKAFDKPGVLYIAPMGSNNFEEHRFLDSSETSEFYGIFFNSRYKIMALLDLGAHMRTFNYKVNPDKTITISAQIDIDSNYGWQVDASPQLDILADATSFGGNISVGVVRNGGKEGLFQPAGVNSTGTITKRSGTGFTLVDDASLEYSTTAKLTLDTHGPIFFLDFNTIFYTSTALGINWVQQSLTFSGPKTHT